VAHDFCVGPGNRGKFAGPVGLFVRPAKPGGFVMLHSAGIQRPRSNGVEPLGAVAWGLFAQPAIQDRTVGMMRRSRRNGQLRRVSSVLAGSHSKTRISSLLSEASTAIWPKDRQRRSCPELEAGVTVGGVAFETDAIHDGDVHAVGDGVRALDGLPGVELRGANSAFSCGCQPMLVDRKSLARH